MTDAWTTAAEMVGELRSIEWHARHALEAWNPCIVIERAELAALQWAIDMLDTVDEPADGGASSET